MSDEAKVEGADIVLEVERKNGNFIIRVGALTAPEVKTIADRLSDYSTKRAGLTDGEE